MPTTRNLNTVAKDVKEKTLQAADRYYKGNKNESILTFKDLIKMAEMLKKSRKGNETVATCQLNLAAAQIGTRKPEKEEEAKIELNKLMEKKIDDSILFAYVKFHLGLISPHPQSLEVLNGAIKCLPSTESGDFDKSSSEKQFEILLLKERALEKIIQILGEQLMKLKPDTEDLQEKMRQERKKVAKMEELEKVYGKLYPLKKKIENILDEDLGEMFDKQVANLLDLGNYHSNGDSAGRRKARYYADRCRTILEEDWSKVHVSICNDLGIIYSQMKGFVEAERCFLKLQHCWSNDEGDRCYVFQNIGAVNVLRENYEDAVHSFKDALHVLEGEPVSERQTDQESVRVLSERRAHLYMNLGFACSQMGRGRIWKTFEAYFNAAKYANKSDPRETALRCSALKGMTISAIVILDYREELVDFVYQYVLKEAKKSDKNPTEFEQIIEVKTPDENYETYIENLKNAVLDRTLPEKNSKLV